MAKQAAAPKRTSMTRNKSVRALEVMTAAPSQVGPTHEAISMRAFELWKARGGTDGHDMNDWFMAERELRSA